MTRHEEHPTLSDDIASGVTVIAAMAIGICMTLGLAVWAISATQRPAVCANLTAAECSAAMQECR